MKILLTPNGLFAVATIIAGICLFGFASILPRVYPPAFSRAVGLAAVLFSLLPLYAYSASWQLPAKVGIPALAVLVVIHLVQTRSPRRQDDDRQSDDEDNAVE